MPPWSSSFSEELQSPPGSGLYSSQNGNGIRRGVNVLNSVDYNSASTLNQNLLLPDQHRFANDANNAATTVTTSSSGVYRSNPKAGPQSAPSSISAPRCGVGGLVDNSEKIRRSTTLAESGVLGSHTNTPTGKIAWPGERQMSWQPKMTAEKQQAVTNLNQTWCSNGYWSPGSNECNQWNSMGLPLTTSISGSVTSPSQNWQQQQSQTQQMGYRMAADKGILYSSQPQMQRIVSISDV